MFVGIFIWIVFCALAIPAFIQASDHGYDVRIHNVEASLNADNYNPKHQSELYELLIAKDQAAGAMWMLAGFGTGYGFMFAAMRIASIGDNKDKLLEFFHHYTEVYDGHMDEAGPRPSCLNGKYCEICSGEWILDTE